MIKGLRLKGLLLVLLPLMMMCLGHGDFLFWVGEVVLVWSHTSLYSWGLSKPAALQFRLALLKVLPVFLSNISEGVRAWDGCGPRIHDASNLRLHSSGSARLVTVYSRIASTPNPKAQAGSCEPQRSQSQMLKL